MRLWCKGCRNSGSNSRTTVLKIVSNQESLGMNSQKAFVGIAVAAASWGTWSVFLRLAEAKQPIAPELETFIVFAIIAVVLLPSAVRTTSRHVGTRPPSCWCLVVAFGISDALNCVLYFTAMQTTSVAVAVLTHYLAPLLVALSAPLVLREPRRPGTLPSLMVGLIGLILLLAPREQKVGIDGARLVKGSLLGLGSAVFYAASVLFNKRLSRSFEATELIVYHLPSALVLLAFLVPHGAWTIAPVGFAWLVAGALGPGAIAGIVFVRCINVVPAGRASVLTLIEPLTALAIAALVWGESLGIRGLLGGAAILASGYFVVRESGPPQGEAVCAPLPNTDTY
jgi:DME family drug/metabolite transporter